MKFKFSLLLLFLLVVLGVVYFLRDNPLHSQGLITPFTNKKIQVSDLHPKLKEKIFIKDPLQFTKVEQIKSLKNIPRYLVYNPDSRVAYAAKNEVQKFSPASFTKLLTTQVALDLANPDKLLTTTSTSINKIPTVLGLKLGEQLTVEELIRASIATSANDAAATLAEGTAASYDLALSDFIDLMNSKANLLGMSDSHFANPEGYDDPNQYSTLLDISKLIDNATANYPLIVSSGKSDREDIIKTKTHGGYYLSNWNGLLGVYPGVNGLKIAYTEEAGHGTIISAQRGGVNLIAIVSGAGSIPERDLAAAALLDYAFIKEKIKPANITKPKLRSHYKQWSDLIKKTRQELKKLKNKK